MLVELFDSARLNRVFIEAESWIRANVKRATQKMLEFFDIFAIGAITISEALDGMADAERDRLFAILAGMKGNLLRKAASANGERRASHG